MNIKEAIEKGLYPTDEKGRALVPMPDGETFVCAVTNAPGRFPLLGWYLESSVVAQYGADFCAVADPRRLLPPPPRKVPMVRWHLLDAKQNTIAWWADEPAREEVAMLRARHDPCRLVRLAGEIEEPWS